MFSSLAFAFNVRPYARIRETVRPLSQLTGYSAGAVAGDTLCEPVMGDNG
jgi:hypothetical protein